jgi:TrmH family RNA methyltransferase
VFTGEHAPSFDHPRCRRAAMGGQAIVTTGRADLGRARELTGSGRRAAVDGAILVLETGGTAVEEFGFPESGVLVLGHEELGVPQEILRRAAGDRRVVTIPHEGDKRSLNVGVAAGICLSWWRVRRHPQE